MHGDLVRVGEDCEGIPTANDRAQQPAGAARGSTLPTVLVTLYLSDHHRIGSQGLLRGIEEWERNEVASLQVTAPL
jgi:hypothetical protein